LRQNAAWFFARLARSGRASPLALQVRIGRTAGRGKKSTSHEQLIAVKDIWLYPLRKDFAAVLCQ